VGDTSVCVLLVGVAGRGLGAPRGLVASSRIQAGLAQRARIVLLAADGLANTDIATRVGGVASDRDRQPRSR
jgi:hypothetical protein